MYECWTPRGSGCRADATHNALVGALLAALSSIGITVTHAQEAPAAASGDEVATPTSTEQGRTTMDQSFAPVTHKEWVAETRREAIHDTKFYGELRSFYFDSNNFNDRENEARALGGSAGFKTGYFRKLFAVGATGYTSQRLYGPENKDGTGLLAPGQHGYSVLGELYSDILLTERVTATVGLRGYDTPYLSRNDSRMTPNTFEGAAAQGSLGGTDGAPGWRFGAGYFNKIKERDSAEFVSMATAAGAPAGVSRGVSVAGAAFSLGDLSFGAIDYYSSDIINIAYVEAKDAFPLTKRLRLHLAVQYTNQRSVGENLLMGHEFSANQFGLKAELAFAGALLTTAYTGTHNGTTMQSPWSGYPGYSSVQIENFDRGGEDAWMLRAAYNFRYPKNLSVYALYVRGSRPEARTQYARDEYDLNVQWKPTGGKLQGLTLIARYGEVSQAGPNETYTNQLRLTLYYDPPWL